MAGEVIGINNQIFSIGLGLAIPSDHLQFLLQQIRDYGRLRLGTIGMNLPGADI
jgi:S1-C subfamily serine protease